MASGHVNRIKRPNTWLHRPMLQNVKKALANPEPSTHGTKPTCRRNRHMLAVGGRTDFAHAARRTKRPSRGSTPKGGASSRPVPWWPGFSRISTGNDPVPRGISAHRGRPEVNDARSK